MPSIRDVSLALDCTRHRLSNGLTVVLHEDHGDPVVGVHLLYHVGSGREEPGRTGFAHLFEHLMFEGSQHVGDNDHFRLVQEAGGTLNGTTNRDRTVYYETLPAAQLELALWLESDRMGFLLPAMTQEKLDNQRDVVRNERRQTYENRPYARGWAALCEALYPQGHAYGWPTIGSHEDLQAATLDDVGDFFRRWYGPENATLVLAGDFESGAALDAVQRWFGDLPSGPGEPPPARRPVRLARDVRVALEDKVERPQLTLCWPTVPVGHADEGALDMLVHVLSANTAARLDRVLVNEERLATMITAWHMAGEQAGEFAISARPVPGVTLAQLEARIRELLADEAREGVAAAHLERLTVSREARMLAGLETVAPRAARLARAEAFRGSAHAWRAELDDLLGCTPEHVEAVHRAWVHEQPAVVLSVVPEGQVEQAAGEVERVLVAHGGAPDAWPGGGPWAAVEADASAADASAESSGDAPAEHVAEARSPARDTAPAPATRADHPLPAFWREDVPGGPLMLGTPYDRLPAVRLTLHLPGGQLRESVDATGSARMLGDLLNEGTARRDAVAFTEAKEHLGCSLDVGCNQDALVVSLWVLERALEPAVELLTELVSEPGLRADDLERLRTARLAALSARGDDIEGTAARVWRRLRFGGETPAGLPSSGTEASVAALELDGLRELWSGWRKRGGLQAAVVGGLDAERTRGLLQPLMDGLDDAPGAPLADVPTAFAAPGGCIHLVDKPGAPQSQFRMGHASLHRHHADHDSLAFANQLLGGTFNSRLNMNLREDKGWTYGVRSQLAADPRAGTLTVSAGVHTDVTADALREVLSELAGLREDISAEEAAFVRDSMLQSMARQYESMAARGALLSGTLRQQLDDDWLAKRVAALHELSRDTLLEAVRAHVRPDDVRVLVVGDAAKLREPLAALGLGEVVELDLDGLPVG